MVKTTAGSIYFHSCYDAAAWSNLQGHIAKSWDGGYP